VNLESALEAWGKGIAGVSNTGFVTRRILAGIGRKGRNFPDLVGIVHRPGRKTPHRSRHVDPIECARNSHLSGTFARRS
jgi:hypothetical protein